MTRLGNLEKRSQNSHNSAERADSESSENIESALEQSENAMRSR